MSVSGQLIMVSTMVQPLSVKERGFISEIGEAMREVRFGRASPNYSSASPQITDRYETDQRFWFRNKVTDRDQILEGLHPV